MEGASTGGQGVAAQAWQPTLKRLVPVPGRGEVAIAVGGANRYSALSMARQAAQRRGLGSLF